MLIICLRIRSRKGFLRPDEMCFGKTQRRPHHWRLQGEHLFQPENNYGRQRSRPSVQLANPADKTPLVLAAGRAQNPAKGSTELFPWPVIRRGLVL